jgi:hypothetical protein
LPLFLEEEEVGRRANDVGDRGLVNVIVVLLLRLFPSGCWPRRSVWWCGGLGEGGGDGSDGRVGASNTEVSVVEEGVAGVLGGDDEAFVGDDDEGQEPEAGGGGAGCAPPPPPARAWWNIRPRCWKAAMRRFLLSRAATDDDDELSDMDMVASPRVAHASLRIVSTPSPAVGTAMGESDGGAYAAILVATAEQPVFARSQAGFWLAGSVDAGYYGGPGSGVHWSQEGHR